MFDNLLSHVLLLYTSIRTKTYTTRQEKLDSSQQNIESDEELQEHGERSIHLINQDLLPTTTMVFDALNGRHAVIGPEACVYRNISIHKKEICLYGGLETYLGFFNILKQHAKHS